MLNLTFHVLLKNVNFGPPPYAMIREFPSYVQLFFTTVHSHLIFLDENEKSVFYTDSAILLGVYEQILEQLGNRPMTGSLSCLYMLMQYIFDNGRAPSATFSHSNLWSYMPRAPYKMSVEPLSNITQVHDIVVFQQQLQLAVDHLQTMEIKSVKRAHYSTNPNNALLQGKAV